MWIDLYDTICKQIVTDELIVEIENNRKQIEFLIDLLDKRQLEEFVNWLSMRQVCVLSLIHHFNNRFTKQADD